MSKELKLSSLRTQVAGVGLKLQRYAGVLFFLLFALVYGFIIMRINLLSNVQVNDVDVAKQVNAAPVPRIDPYAITQLESLKDNSVNVQTLFQQGRTNPFRE